VKVSVEMKLRDIVGEMDNNLPRCLSIVAEQVRADSDQYVPRLTGDLRTFVNIQTDKNEADLIYNSKYAKYQWYGVGMKHYTTLGTGPEWCEVARRQHGQEWGKVLVNGLLR
jgi:hypothetical protein